MSSGNSLVVDRYGVIPRGSDEPNMLGSAILAVGEIAKTVVVDDDDELDVARVMKLTLSCDHRVIDGAAGGRFIHDLKRIIEAPVRALY